MRFGKGNGKNYWVLMILAIFLVGLFVYFTFSGKLSESYKEGGKGKKRGQKRKKGQKGNSPSRRNSSKR